MSGSLEVEYGKLKFCAHLQYSKRKTLSISVLPDCSIVATAPMGADIAQIIKMVKKPLVIIFYLVPILTKIQ